MAENSVCTSAVVRLKIDGPGDFGLLFTYDTSSQSGQISTMSIAFWGASFIEHVQHVQLNSAFHDFPEVQYGSI